MVFSTLLERLAAMPDEGRGDIVVGGDGLVLARVLQSPVIGGDIDPLLLLVAAADDSPRALVVPTPPLPVLLLVVVVLLSLLVWPQMR